MPNPKNTKTSDTIYSWNGRQVNKRFSDSINFQRNYANKMYEAGKKDFDFDKIKRGMNLMPGPGTLKKKFDGGSKTTTYNMSPYKMKSPYGMMGNQQNKKSIKKSYGVKASQADIIKKHGEIRPASSKLTQTFRKAKAYIGPEGRGSNIGLALSLVAPVPGKKLKVAKNLLTGAKNYVGQVLKHGFKKTKTLREVGVKSTKDLRYADKGWSSDKILKNEGLKSDKKFGSYSSKRGQRRSDGSRY